MKPTLWLLIFEAIKSRFKMHTQDRCTKCNTLTKEVITFERKLKKS